MESEINKQIREILEMYGIDYEKVIGDYNLIGHLVKVFNYNRKEHYQRMASMINSHGFIGYLMGEYRLNSYNSKFDDLKPKL